MTYSQVFGGATLYPSQQTYLSLTFAADVQLSWPIEQQIGGNVVADIIDMDATLAGLNVDIPDARQVSNGIQSVFNNVGSNTVTIQDALGGTIITVAPGEAWVAYLTDNTTVDGSWRTFQLGATVSVANASALAGAGLKAISTTLNQTLPPRTTSSTPVTVTDSDRSMAVIWTGGVGIANLPDPATIGSDWFYATRNSGSGDLTLTPAAGLIDGSGTLDLAPGESTFIFTDGVNYFTVGYGQASTSVFDFISIAVPGSGDYTLSGVELNRVSYRFTGAITGTRNIVVPNTVQQYWVDNQTTGAFNFFVKTVAQVPGIQILTGDRAILYSDGTDVVNASSTTVVFPIVIGQGGTGAITAGAALTNLGGVPTTRVLNGGVGIQAAGLGDLSADRTINAQPATETQVGVAELATQAETDAGADDARIVTPLKLATRTATETQTGIIELATQAEVDAGVDAVRAVTPATLAATTSLPILGFDSYVLKTADESVTNSTALQNDDELVISGLAAGTYAFEMALFFTASSAFDLKIDFDNSANVTTFTAVSFSESTGNVLAGTIGSETVDTNHEGQGPTNVAIVTIDAVLVVGAAGQIGLRFAQVTMGGTSTTVKAGSWMRLKTVA